jgi:hypothetical protein
MLVARDLSVEHVRDTDGIIRVELVLPSWEDYLAGALDEIIALPGCRPASRAAFFVCLTSSRRSALRTGAPHSKPAGACSARWPKATAATPKLTSDGESGGRFWHSCITASGGRAVEIRV